MYTNTHTSFICTHSNTYTLDRKSTYTHVHTFIHMYVCMYGRTHIYMYIEHMHSILLAEQRGQDHSNTIWTASTPRGRGVRYVTVCTTTYKGKVPPRASERGQGRSAKRSGPRLTPCSIFKTQTPTLRGLRSLLLLWNVCRQRATAACSPSATGNPVVSRVYLLFVRRLYIRVSLTSGREQQRGPRIITSYYDVENVDATPPYCSLTSIIPSARRARARGVSAHWGGSLVTLEWGTNRGAMGRVRGRE